MSDIDANDSNSNFFTEIDPPEDQVLIDDTVEVNIGELAPEPLMFVSLSFSDHVNISALVDTGATMSLIQSNLVNIKEIQTTSQEVSGLGNNCVKVLGLINLNICLGGLMLPCSFLVVPEKTIKHKVILGSNIFADHGIFIDFSRKRLSGSLSDGFWEYYTAQDDDHAVLVLRDLAVYCKEKTNLSNTEPTLVPIYVKSVDLSTIDNCEFYYDGLVNKKLSKYAQGQEGILSPKQESFSVLIEKLPDSLGYSDHIQAGECLGLISTILDKCSSAEVNVASTNIPMNIDNLKELVTLDNLDPAQSETVYNMLSQHSNVFSKHEHDIGCAGVTQHRIELHDTTPIRQKPRRFPEPVVNEIEKQCDQLREHGIIEYSKSPWSSSIVPVVKPNGTIRLCIDYRKLNRVTKSDRFPMPNISDLVYNLQGTKYFSSIDLTQGFYQVPLDPESAEYTAFSTSRNHYQFRRLPFGLKNAPTAFQREMQTILRDFEPKGVIIYIDDILIMSNCFEDHCDLVSRVLHTLDIHDIKIKLSKCCFFQEEVKFLGHMIGSNGIRKSDEYMKSVKDFPKPTKVSQLRSFLGLINFQRKFIPQCSIVAKPLTQWMCKPDKCCLDWDYDMELAFQSLKDLMCKSIELAYPNYSSDAPLMELSTDASQYGAGACLTQIQEGKTRVIGYASTTFNKAETQYSTIERELAAIRWALSVFRGFIYGIPFVLYTDHRPLVYMHNMSKFNSRLYRTMNDIAVYQFEIRYRAGKENTIADILSRLNAPSTDNDIPPTVNSLPQGITILERVEGGGNSMIDSLMKILTHHQGLYDTSINVPLSSIELRQLLVNEILANPLRYEIKFDKVTKGKFKLYTLPDVMLPEVFLLAFSHLYQLQVWVHHGFNNPVIYRPDGVITGDITSRIHLQCLAMTHYNPATENRLYEPPLLIGRDPMIDSIEVSCACDDHSIPDITLDDNLLISNCNHPLPGSSSSTVMTIEDFKCCALIDTGAQVSLLSSAVWNNLSDDYKQPCHYSDIHTSIRGIGSELINTEGYAYLKFYLGDALLDCSVPFAIVDSKDMPFCAIIGANVINSCKISIDYALRAFKLSSELGNVSHSMTRVSPNNLSNICLANEIIQDESVPGCLQLSLDQLYSIQQGNHAIKLLANKVYNEIDPKTWKPKCLLKFKRHFAHLSVVDGILWYQLDRKSVPIIPFNFLIEVMLKIHWHMSHMGRNKLINLIQSNCWHPEIASVASDICNSCIHCQLCKTSAQVHTPPMLKIQARGPFSLIAADLMVLPKTPRGYIGLLVVVDHYTKWLSIVPIKNKQANTVASAFEHHILPKLPVKPSNILTDNGVEFSSEIFNRVLDNYDIKHIYSTPYKPSSNGAVERINRTVTEMLRLDVEDPATWDDKLTKVVLTYNNSWHSQLKMSPSEFLMSTAHTHNNDPILSTADSFWKESHPNYAPFKVGDKVLKKIKLIGNLTLNKLSQRYSGIYVVKQVNKNKVTYVIAKEGASSPNLIKVHHSQLRSYVSPPKYILNHTYHNHLMTNYNATLQESDVSSCSSSDSEEDDVLPLTNSGNVSSSESEECYPVVMPQPFTNPNITSASPLDFSGFESVPQNLAVIQAPQLMNSPPRDFSGFENLSGIQASQLNGPGLVSQGLDVNNEPDFSGFTAVPMAAEPNTVSLFSNTQTNLTPNFSGFESVSANGCLECAKEASSHPAPINIDCSNTFLHRYQDRLSDTGDSNVYPCSTHDSSFSDECSFSSNINVITSTPTDMVQMNPCPLSISPIAFNVPRSNNELETIHEATLVEIASHLSAHQAELSLLELNVKAYVDQTILELSTSTQSNDISAGAGVTNNFSPQSNLNQSTFSTLNLGDMFNSNLISSTPPASVDISQVPKSSVGECVQSLDTTVVTQSLSVLLQHTEVAPTGAVTRPSRPDDSSHSLQAVSLCQGAGTPSNQVPAGSPQQTSAEDDHDKPYLKKLLTIRKRLSFSPVRKSVDDLQNVIDEYRRRSRSRIVSAYRGPIEASSNHEEEASKDVQPRPYHTRSKGPVPTNAHL